MIFQAGEKAARNADFFNSLLERIRLLAVAGDPQAISAAAVLLAATIEATGR